MLGFAAPAHAITPPPTVLDFESASLGPLDEGFYAGAGATLAAPPAGEPYCGVGRFVAAAPLECGTVVRPGHDSEQGLAIDSGGVFEIRFAAKQANVSLWLATPGVGSSYDLTVEAWPDEPGVGTRIDPGPAITDASPFGKAAVVKTEFGDAEIGSVRIFTGGCLGCGSEFSVDDISFSPFAQPDTEILSGPPAVSRSRDASFLFIGNQADSRFECSLDGVSAPCRAPVAYTGLADGAHRSR